MPQVLPQRCHFLLYQAKINPLILNYVELGYIEDLKWRYLGKQRLCESVSEMVLFGKTIQYSLDHTGGLFLVLLVAIGVSFLILILEHVMYFVLLPRLKKMPPTSIWKNRNMEFFSQVLIHFHLETRIRVLHKQCGS